MTVFNLARCLDRNAANRGDDAAVIFGNVRLSHAELAQRVHSVAAGLRSCGIGKGDVVAVLMPNAPEFLEATFAINGCGAIFLPLNTRLAIDEWAYILDHAECRAIMVDDSFYEHMGRLRSRCPAVTQVFVVGGNANGNDVTYASLLEANSSDRAPFAAMDGDDVSRLMYTSGTTARPKGVPLTHGNVQWKIFDHVIEFGLTAADRTLMAGPMYHVGAYDLPGIGTLYVGGSLVILPSFDATAVLRAAEYERVTNVWLAPSMVNAVLQVSDAGRFDTSSVRFVTNGGEKMPVALIERFLALFHGAWLADSFGMTETVSGDTVLDHRMTISKIGSVGKPLLHLDIRIARDDGTDAGVGEPGELLITGPKVFRGYWNDAEATKDAFVDGWFKTGDIAHLDADGYLYIDDRKKDMIISGGENIASSEIERVLYDHPAVLEAAVVGMPDDRWGEVPKAVVALRPGTGVTERELIEHCGAHLAKYKVPTRVEFVDGLPRTPSGKVLKRALR